MTFIRSTGLAASLVVASSVVGAGAGCEPSAKPPVTPTVDASSGDAAAPPTPSSPPPASDAAAATPRDEKRLFVADKIVDCEGEGPMKCMRVRESETAPWTLLYSPIEGFKHVEGHAYELRVRVRHAPNAPMDAPSQDYVLIEVVSDHAVGVSPKK